MTLPYIAQGLTLSFAWFVAINAAACAGVAALGGWLTRRSGMRPPAFWIVLRLLPALAASAFVLFFFIPSYWQYEPRESVEGFDLTLALVAGAGAAVVAAAIARGAAAWRGAATRTRAWMRHARPLSIKGAPFPAVAIDADQPIIALVGVFRPRLLVTRGLTDALTPAELAASVAHEVGHHRALDNLKRLAMRAAPDLLACFPVARAIERRWASAAEHAADRAGAHDARARCALASALVKVARLTPPVVPMAEPISTLLAGGEIASRVQELLDDGARAGQCPSRRALWLATALVLAALSIFHPPLLRLIHEVTEFLVSSLP